MNNSADISPRVNFDLTVTMSSKSSGVVDLSGCTLVGLRTPEALVSTTLSFKSAEKSTGTFMTVKNSSGTTFSLTVSTSSGFHYMIDPTKLAGVRHLKVISNSAETAKAIGLVTRAWA